MKREQRREMARLGFASRDERVGFVAETVAQTKLKLSDLTPEQLDTKVQVLK